MRNNNNQNTVKPEVRAALAASAREVLKICTPIERCIVQCAITGLFRPVIKWGRVALLPVGPDGEDLDKESFVLKELDKNDLYIEVYKQDSLLGWGVKTVGDLYSAIKDGKLDTRVMDYRIQHVSAQARIRACEDLAKATPLELRMLDKAFNAAYGAKLEKGGFVLSPLFAYGAPKETRYRFVLHEEDGAVTISEEALHCSMKIETVKEFKDFLRVFKDKLNELPLKTLEEVSEEDAA